MMMRLNSIKQLFIIITLMVCTTGCFVHQKLGPEFTPDGKPTYEEFVASNSFPYIAKQERQKFIRTNYESLSLGMIKAQVENILGNPDESKVMCSKENNPPRLLGTSWTYFFEKPNPNIVNLKDDKCIEIFFDPNGKVDVICSNIFGLESKNCVGILPNQPLQPTGSAGG